MPVWGAATIREDKGDAPGPPQGNREACWERPQLIAAAQVEVLEAFQLPENFQEWQVS